MLRKLVATLLLLLWPGCLLTPAYAQRAVLFGQNYPLVVTGSVLYANGCAALAASALTTVGCTIAGVATGTTIVVQATYQDNHTVTLTDNGGSTNIVVLSPTSGGAIPVLWGSGTFQEWIWVIHNAASGSHVLLATDSTSPGQPPWITAISATGANTTSPVDQSSVTASVSNTITATSITTASGGELLVTFCSIGGSGHPDPVSPSNTPQTMTQRQSAVNYSIGATSTAASSGSNFTQCTQTFGDNAVIDLIALKP